MFSRYLKKNIFFLFFLLLLPLSIFSATPKDCKRLIIEGIDAMNEKDYKRSLQLLIESRDIAKKNRWYNEQFLAVNNIGANYYRRLDYGEALNNYLDAYKIAISHLDEKSEMTILNNIAILYAKDKKNGKAEEYFLKAYHLAGKSNNTLSKGLYAINLSIISNEKHDFINGKIYIDEALKLTENSPYSLFAQATYVENLVNLKRYDEAKKIAFRLLPKLNDDENSEHKTQILFNLSTIEEQTNNLSHSFYYLKLAKKSNLSYDFRENIFDRLSALYRKENNIDRALAYKDSIIIVKDSLNKIKNGQLFENSRIKFELKNTQKDLAESKVYLNNQRSVFTLILILAFLTIVFIIWALKNIILKNKQQKLIEKSSSEIAHLELEQEKRDKKILENQLKEKDTLALLEEERYKNEIEQKNRKLTTKALQLTTKIELIDDLLKTLSQTGKGFENQEVNNIIQQLNVYQRRSREEESFLIHFEEVNQGFVSKLKALHPILNANDIRFLSYIYMNLSLKEISSLLSITPEACRKRKERIIKKMEQEDGLDLYHYLTII